MMRHSDILRRLIDLSKILGVAALYALFFYGVHLYLKSSTSAGVFQPASGLALAALLIGGRRYALGVFLGAVLGGLMSGSSFAVSLFIALGNTLAVLTGVALLTRNGKSGMDIGSLRDFLSLIWLGGCVAAIVAALAGNMVLLASGNQTFGAYLNNLIHWWMGDVLGVILIAPLILAWRKIEKTHAALTPQAFVPVLLIGFSVFAGKIIYLGWFHESIGEFAKGYWMFLFIVWIAVRLGLRGVTVVLLVVALQGLAGAYLGVGYFKYDIARTQQINFWFYMLTLSIVGTALATFFAEHKRAEDELRTSMASLRAMLDNSPYIAWLKDADGRYVNVNKAYVENVRLQDASQVIGKTDFDFWPQELAEKYRQVDADVMASRQRRHVEESALDGDRVHWVETFKTPVIDGQGQVLGTAGFSYDISERKLTEENLRKLSMAVEQNPSSVIITDLDGNMEYVNEAFVKSSGYRADEVIGRNPRMLNSGKNPKSVYSELWARLICGQVWQGELVNRRRDGSEYIVSMLVTPVRDENRRVTHYVAVREDITERKKNEAKLERLSRAYRLLSRVNEAIVRAQGRDELFQAICDAAIESELFRFVWIPMLDEQRSAVIPAASAGVDDGYLDTVSIRIGDELTGNGPSGRAIRDSTHVVCQDIETDPVMAHWRDEAMKRGYRSLGTFPFSEARVVVGGISVYAAESHFFTPDIVRLMLELATDISFALDTFAEKKRRKAAEGQLKLMNVELERRVLERTQQLELVNRELEAFSYSVSHDLRAPLRSIDGFSQILFKKYHDQLDSVAIGYLERVRRASQRMGHLIDDLLRLSQVTRGQLKRDPVDLSRIAEKAADELRKTNPGRMVQFKLQPDVMAYGDPGLLRIVMDNLLGNACKYTGKKDVAEIEFGVSEGNISEGGANEGMPERAFFVRDNGAGFNMKYAHKLFGAFQRLHGAQDFEGTGIGLATVQRIINRHRGKVWAEGREGQGATFYFTLPQRDQERDMEQQT